MARLTKCHYCGKWYDYDFGREDPAAHLDAAGTRGDPRSPGDHARCCDVCCFSEPRECKGFD